MHELKPFELDVENRGNLYIAQLRPARRAFARFMTGSVALISRVSRVIRKQRARVKRAQAQTRAQRSIIERELFAGRYRLKSKSDDDLPVVSS